MPYGLADNSNRSKRRNRDASNFGLELSDSFLRSGQRRYSASPCTQAARQRSAQLLKFLSELGLRTAYVAGPNSVRKRKRLSELGRWRRRQVKEGGGAIPGLELNENRATLSSRPAPAAPIHPRSRELACGALISASLRRLVPLAGRQTCCAVGSRAVSAQLCFSGPAGGVLEELPFICPVVVAVGSLIMIGITLYRDWPQ